MEGGKLENLEKNPRWRLRSKIIKPRPHWWEASTLTTALLSLQHIITVLMPLNFCQKNQITKFSSLRKGYYKLNMIALLLFQTFQDEGISNYIVVYLRLLTSAQLQKKADFFENFIEGGRTVQEFRSQVKNLLLIITCRLITSCLSGKKINYFFLFIHVSNKMKTLDCWVIKSFMLTILCWSAKFFLFLHWKRNFYSKVLLFWDQLFQLFRLIWLTFLKRTLVLNIEKTQHDYR